MYPGLRYAPKKLKFACQKKIFGKCLFEYKDRFAVEKKVLRQFQNYWENFLLSPSKKILVIQFPYIKLYDKHFLRQKIFLPCLVRYTYFYPKTSKKMTAMKKKFMKFV